MSVRFSAAKREENDTSATRAKYLLAMASAGSVLIGLICLLHENNATPLMVSVGIAAAGILLWPLYELAEDTKAVRRLLEDAARK